MTEPTSVVSMLSKIGQFAPQTLIQIILVAILAWLIMYHIPQMDKSHQAEMDTLHSKIDDLKMTIDDNHSQSRVSKRDLILELKSLNEKMIRIEDRIALFIPTQR